MIRELQSYSDSSKTAKKRMEDVKFMDENENKELFWHLSVQGVKQEEGDKAFDLAHGTF